MFLFNHDFYIYNVIYKINSDEIVSRAVLRLASNFKIHNRNVNPKMYERIKI